ncbi:latent-transforming growth factor beta-binding protein 2-like [Sardina pilchardus]|uniref:latent-transforming growth factor beta-binding protein 2-like n=1 Tax=Sardina pilchardus TaxID=27697 RepID=UPI002E0E1218
MDGSWIFVLAALTIGLTQRCDSHGARAGGRHNATDRSLQTAIVSSNQKLSSVSSLNISHHNSTLPFGETGGKDGPKDESKHQLTDSSLREGRLRRRPRQLSRSSSTRHRTRTVTGGDATSNGGKPATSKRLVGPHVCGQQCCSGWAVARGTNRCIKPDCQPPCQNRGSCSRPHTCVCRSGFQGARCEEVAPEQVYVRAGGRRAFTPVQPSGQQQQQQQQLVRRESVEKQPAESSFRAQMQRPATTRLPLSSLTTQTREGSASSSSRQTGTSRTVKRYPESTAHLNSNALPTENRHGNELGPGLLSNSPRLQDTSGQGSINSAVSPSGANLTAGVDRIKIVFTPMVCRWTCSGGRCSNSCERGEKTTVYSENQNLPPKSQGFRLFFCQIPCLSGGRCIGQNQCWCPSNSTGKFCHLPAPPPSRAPTQGANGNGGHNSSSHSMYTLPLSNQGAHTHLSMVNVHIQHPPEAEVQVHQVARVKPGQNAQNQNQSRDGSSHSVQQRSQPAHANDHHLNNGHGNGNGNGRTNPTRPINRQNGHVGRCFQETVDGQCGMPLPGLTKQDDCCGSVGASWGLNKCTECPIKPAYAVIANGQVECPKGFKRLNSTHCQDINECLMSGICKHAECLNTRGSYRCTCKPGYMLDPSRSHCVSDKAVSVVKDFCYRSTSDGTCSLPLPQHITKQICCCSRVGKAWGSSCQRCPVPDTEHFREICPAGHGYTYSHSDIQISLRKMEDDEKYHPATQRPYFPYQPQLPQIPSHRPHRPSYPQTPVQPQVPSYESNVPQVPQRPHRPSYPQTPSQPQVPSYESNVPQVPHQPHRPSYPQTPSQPQVPSYESNVPQVPQRPHRPSYPQTPANPQVPSYESEGHQGQEVPTFPQAPTQPRPSRIPPLPHHPSLDPHQTGRIPSQGAPHDNDAYAAEVIPSTESPSGFPDLMDVSTPPITTHSKPDSSLKDRTTASRNVSKQVTDVDRCAVTPTICGPGQCVSVQTGYTCHCYPGYQLNALQTQCIDINECEQNLCGENARCVNAYGSYSCHCQTGFSQVITQNRKFCQDVNECDMPNKCPGGHCVNTEGSYTCECTTGFIKNGRGQCEDVNECLSSAVCANGYCTNTKGSYQCVCNFGYETAPDQSSCQDVDECSLSGVCEHGRCTNLQGSYSCSCNVGYRATLNDKACDDINECATTNVCPNGICANTEGSYTCTNCQPGFIKSADGQKCEDIDECAVSDAVCLDGVCTNTEGSYTCTLCGSGYRLSLDRQQCEDVDECLTESICNNGICLNSDGSYSCTACPTGYLVSSDGEICEDIDECRSPGACPLGLCTNTPGSFSCMACDTGYTLSSDKITCEDVDECEEDVCLGGECTNTPGSFSCSCTPGFEHHETTGCTDVNECLAVGVCGDGDCLNTEGSFLCICPVGYAQAKDGLGCHDVDECEKGNVCFQGECLNTDGSFQCVCEAGYKFSAQTGDCEDLDECKEYGSDVCGTWHCENTLGSYRCFMGCQPGFSNGDCDIDECVNETICGEHGFCENTDGSYRCQCYRGYANAPDTQVCVDINECETSTDYCGEALCENVEGSFLCICTNEDEEFDPISNQCHSTRGGLMEHMGVLFPSVAPPHGEERKECYYNLNDANFCLNVLSHNATIEECCCTVGAGWGDNCEIHPCPPTGRAEYDQLCPKGNGVLPVTTDFGQQLFKDADECAMFGSEICKNGICTNLFSSYSCYCQNGYYYDNIRLECVDHDECLDEGTCEGGVCVNIAGSFNCFCSPPLVLDNTRRRCVSANGTDDGQGLEDDIHMDICWQQLTDDDMCSRPLLGLRTTYTECCCLHGIAWGKLCAFCPLRSSEDFATLCNVPHRGSDSLRERPGYEYGPDLPLPQNPWSVDPYWSNYGPLEGGGTYFDPEDPQSVPLFTDPSSDYSSRETIGRPVHRPREDLSPVHADDYRERYDSFEGLRAEECGVLNGCENGRCVRVREGYTCDCFDGYELDLTKMACMDINECKDINDKVALCKNGECVNSEGSYKCNCLPGFAESSNPHECVPETQTAPPAGEEK